MNHLTQIKRELNLLANPTQAKLLQKFFKTGAGQYGEGDIFLGITVPQQRQIAKAFYKSVALPGIDKLLRSKIHEQRLTALLILTYKFAVASEKEQQRIYKFYLAHTKWINNWDLVDVTCPKIVGRYLRGKPKNILYKLAKSKNLWEKRIAILATFDFIYVGQPQTALDISTILIGDNHDLIHKAVGWMLREIGKRCGEKYLTDFLDQHSNRMPRTMLRYAIERLPDAKRKYYLLKK